ncbi:MAG: hypothetical protein QOG83_3674 [Alphaproteobacteria bacterium]|jgi:hypothetical protein|nr:hypothetical protein [Alphaproteobacteria bacterium]
MGALDQLEPINTASRDELAALHLDRNCDAHNRKT